MAFDILASKGSNFRHADKFYPTYQRY